MSDEEQMIESLYDRFNGRDIEGVLSNLSENVVWANGMENTHVHGREAVREYWTHQWLVINPRVSPLKVITNADGSILVEVHQIVHDLDGKLLLDEKVGHVFQVEGGKVKRFDIQPGSQLSAVSH
jgi:ketosteroid isomerase-like protein